MIKMTRGTYSLRGENGLTHLVGIKDEPFEILETAGGADEEARLVSAGVAEYVGKPRKETPSEETPEETPEEDIPEIPDENPDEEPKAKKKPATKRR